MLALLLIMISTIRSVSKPNHSVLTTMTNLTKSNYLTKSLLYAKNVEIIIINLDKNVGSKTLA